MSEEATYMWVMRASYGWEWGVQGDRLKATGCSPSLVQALAKVQDEVLWRHHTDPLAHPDGQADA
jgi:hypothetical protein